MFHFFSLLFFPLYKLKWRQKLCCCLPYMACYLIILYQNVQYAIITNNDRVQLLILIYWESCCIKKSYFKNIIFKQKKKRTSEKCERDDPTKMTLTYDIFGLRNGMKVKKFQVNNSFPKICHLWKLTFEIHFHLN